jgi:hypothetical protein
VARSGRVSELGRKIEKVVLLESVTQIFVKGFDYSFVCEEGRPFFSLSKKDPTNYAVLRDLAANFTFYTSRHLLKIGRRH